MTKPASLWPALAKALALLVLTKAAHAQHETGADVFSGEQYFQNYCASCHGAAGNLIVGVDLGHGAFRQPYTDAELKNIVMNGITGKAMPATPNMSSAQADEVVKYLRSRAVPSTELTGGIAERGKALFAGKGNCANCHRIAGMGGRLGPDLSKIGVTRTASHLTESLLEPNKEVQPNSRYFTVVTKQGQRTEGRLLNQDPFTVQMLDTNEQLRSFNKRDLQSFAFAASPMPSVKDQLNEQELADLVQYLVSLRGGK